MPRRNVFDSQVAAIARQEDRKMLALAIARRIAPKIKVNGLTAADILAMDEQREKEKTCF